MHARGNIPQLLWAEMVNTASYILNRTGPSSIKLIKKKKRTMKIMILCNMSWEEEFIEEQEENAQHERESQNLAEIGRPQRFDDYIMSTILDVTQLEEPAIHEEAVSSLRRKDWSGAMDSKMGSLTENET
ncbi:hypothetical protein PR048_021805 [Dryococelus australis]|uniref:Polyprotein n=1 Tax=Dryococelus australis TaxID=614101 RepID=A0ABQ9GZ76_9NEOP|nr:hypothetical protein PR048_021805 [Dryococelus australis]